MIYASELVLDLERKLNLYSDRQEEEPIFLDNNKCDKYIEIILEVYTGKSIEEDVLHNYNLEVKENKLSISTEYLSKIGVRLYEKFYFEKNSSRFLEWLKVILTTSNHSIWYWLREVSKFKEVREDFLDEILSYIIRNKSSKESWYHELKIAYENKSQYDRFFDIENTPEKFNSLFDTYCFFKKEKFNDFLFKYMNKDIRLTLLSVLINEEVPKSYYYNDKTYSRINKLIEECSDDYLLIGELFTNNNIRFNTYLLSHPTYTIFGFLNIIYEYRNYPNIKSKDFDYEKSWLNVLSIQIQEIFFKSCESIDLSTYANNIFNLLNILSTWHFKEYSHNYLVSNIFEVLLEKLITTKIKQKSHNIVFDVISQDLIEKQIQQLEKHNKIKVNEYFLLGWYLKTLDIREKILDKDYSGLKSMITIKVFGNIKTYVEQSIHDKYLYLNKKEEKKIDFALFYIFSTEIIKRKWFSLLDFNILKQDISLTDNRFYASSLIRFYFKILLDIYEKNEVESIEKQIIDIALNFGIKERLGIFYFEDESLLNNFFHQLNSFTDERFIYFLNQLSQCNYISFYVHLYNNSLSSNRKKKIKEKLDSISIEEIDFDRYPELENSINFAINNGLSELASKLVNIYEKSVKEDNLLHNDKLNHFKEVKYRKDLADICFSNQEEREKIASINKLSLPTEEGQSQNIYINSDNLNEYKTFITALVYIESNSKIAYEILKELCDKSLNSLYLIQMLRAYYETYKEDINYIEKFQYILLEYTKYEEQLSYEKGIYDYQILLTVYVKINDIKNIHSLWNKMPIHYRYNLYNIEIYCEFLRKNGQSTEALSFLEKIETFHKELDNNESIINKLKKGVKDNIIIDIEQNVSHLTILDKTKELTKKEAKEYWLQIKNMDADAHAFIFKKEMNKIEYIKNIMIEIAEELLIRKKNLERNESNGLELEDIINDWVTSLLTHRKNHLGWKILDQKRGGVSGTTNGVGEKDITVKTLDNKKLFLFEAFKTDYVKHLNKLDGYNADGNEMIVIFVYMKNDNFVTKCNDYKNKISQ